MGTALPWTGSAVFFFRFPSARFAIDLPTVSAVRHCQFYYIKKDESKRNAKEKASRQRNEGYSAAMGHTCVGVVQCVWKAKTKGNDFIGRLSVVISHIVFRRKTYSIKNSSRGKKSADEYNSPRPSVGRPAAPFDQGSPNKGNFEPSAPSSVGATIAHSLGAHNSCCAFQGPRYLLPHWSAPHLLCS